MQPHLITNVLDVDVPMISAVNGPCNMHSEVPLLGDIVLASEDAYFQDASHFPRGQVPGDGQHVIWSFLAGHTRARYLLLTGKKLGAPRRQDWGAVAEVHPKDAVLDRAWELARELVKRPPLTLRYSRQLFTQNRSSGPSSTNSVTAWPRDLRAAGVLPVRRRNGSRLIGPGMTNPWT
jgi:enoyl-CoA hydratase/carnithine racemase